MSVGGWLVFMNGRYRGRAATKGAATTLCDRPWQRGFCTVFCVDTGEAWERRRGSWFRLDRDMPAPGATPARPIPYME